MGALRMLTLGALFALPAGLGAQATVTAVPSTRPAARTDDVRDLERLAKGEHVTRLPSADSITTGPRRIAAGTTYDGTIVARGPIDVLGVVTGSVVSLSGDVKVHRGGVVRGDALAVGGRVLADSGQVDGEMRSMTALPSMLSPVTPIDARTPFERTLDAARLVAGVFGVLLIIAIGVLLFARPNLDEVVGTLERQFGKAFWFGLLGQLLILPALVVLVLALAVSIIGILLIPFAIVVYAIAIAGLAMLGFLAVARLVGGAFQRSATSATERSKTLTALASGVAVFFVLWGVAALLTWAPLAATVVRAAAFAATWAALTLGLGAAILSRAGTHRRIASGGRAVELASWQTPTPITGVVAARRPAIVREAR